MGCPQSPTLFKTLLEISSFLACEYVQEGGVKEDAVHYIALSLPAPLGERCIVRGGRRQKESPASMLMGKARFKYDSDSSRELSQFVKLPVPRDRYKHLSNDH